jgi:low temperature requirement protein LtrA
MDLLTVILIILIVAFTSALLLLWRYFHQEDERAERLHASRQDGTGENDSTTE